jgi:hypothetical protein
MSDAGLNSRRLWPRIRRLLGRADQPPRGLDISYVGEQPTHDDLHDPEAERRYWLDEHRGYVPLSEFSPLMLAVRKAQGADWERYHPREPSIEERARQIAERRSGMPSYLVDDETWDAAMAEAKAERGVR